MPARAGADLAAVISGPSDHVKGQHNGQPDRASSARSLLIPGRLGVGEHEHRHMPELGIADRDAVGAVRIVVVPPAKSSAFDGDPTSAMRSIRASLSDIAE